MPASWDSPSCFSAWSILEVIPLLSLEITEPSQASRRLVLPAPPPNQARVLANRKGAAKRATKRLHRRRSSRRDGPIYPAPVARCLISSRMPPIRQKIADSRKRSKWEEMGSNRRRIPATLRLERELQTHPLQRAKLASIQAPGNGRRGWNPNLKEWRPFFPKGITTAVVESHNSGIYTLHYARHWMGAGMKMISPACDGDVHSRMNLLIEALSIEGNIGHIPKKFRSCIKV